MPDPLETHLVAQLGRQRIGFWHERRARAVIARVPSDRPTVVADIGAGAGVLGTMLRRDRPLARYRFHEPLDGLRSRLVATFGEDACLPTIDGIQDADVIAMLDVLEHVEDEAPFLSSICAAARAGAPIVLTVPALPALWSSWDELLGHHRRYTKASLRRAVGTGGVAVEETSYLFPELLPAALVRRLLRASDEDADEDFPELPRPLDRLLYGIGSLTYRGRRWAPVGTSLLCVGHAAPR
jgi:hypothetical protein